MNKLLIIYSIAFFCSTGICNSQNVKPSVESINSQYYSILPKDKSKISFNVRIKEFQPTFDQIAKKVLDKGDIALAKQLTDFHAKVMYDQTTDSTTIELSPLNVKENSDPSLANGIDKINSGFKQAVGGGFEQVKVLLIKNILEGFTSQPKIVTESGKITVTFDKKDSKEKYIFLSDYSEVKVSSISNNGEITGLLRATKTDEKQLINYAEVMTSQVKVHMDFVYVNKDGQLLLSELKSLNELPAIKANITFLFSDWIIE